MKICFFIKHEISWGSSRERIGVYLEHIKKRGHTYKIISVIPNNLSQIWIGRARPHSLFSSIYSFWCSRVLKHLKLIWIIIAAKRFDLIVIQKVNLLYPLIWILRLRNRNIVFDFDDLCFWNLESPQKRIGFVKRFNFWRRGIQHPAVLKLYSRIIAGNRYLADIACASKSEDGVTIIPTPIDCNLYHFVEKGPQNASLIIGWAGSGENHLRHLELLVDPLKELIKRYDIVFKLVGAMYSPRIKALFKFLNSKFICIDWAEHIRLLQLIRTFDIGVMPLRDDEESRGKCGFKALQYMALGVPVVISPVGINEEIVQDGINGFLARDPSEWVKKLSTLIENEGLRNEFAQNGRRTVEENYSLDKTSKAFLEIIERP